MPSLNDKVIWSYLEPDFNLIKIHSYHVTVALRNNEMPTALRGQRLMGLEKELRKYVDRRIEVFLEPKGDANVLRTRLRGVKT